MEPSDTSVLARALARDPQALDLLLREHLPGLHAYVRLRLGSALRKKEASADVVQSACREALEHLESFKHPSEEGFRHWLYVTAARKIQHRIEHWHAQKREAAREVPLEAGSSTDGGGAGLLGAYRTFCTPSQELASQEEIARIESAFDRLPEEYREVITLAKVVGLPHARIAIEMGRSEGAARMLLARALARMAELMEI